ncbi:MAG: glycogen synthase GlgA [Methylophilaceae bacterium]|nr:glycogen synthase GlgA [Methylophilaceae bacterium]
MRILIATSEAYPLIKTGGLADVSGSLADALRKQAVDARILIPGYPQVLAKTKDLEPIQRLDFIPQVGSVTLLQGTMPDRGTPVYVLDHPYLYRREGGPYQDMMGRDWADNPLRFGVLSHVAAVMSSGHSPLEWKPDIVHCNDWQTGLTPAILHYFGTSRAKTVLGIHNLAYQGNFAPEWVTLLGLPPHSYQIEGVEYYGQMSFLKAGVYYADAIITVSPTYAKEIQTDEYGCGMQGLLKTRARVLRGILNGIDTREWNPAIDPYLVRNYDIDRIGDKQANKEALQLRLDLDVDPHAPLLAVVSRLAYQKGLDLLLACASTLVHEGAQIVLLGSGDPALEFGFNQLHKAHPGRVSVTIGYSESLSHQIMAGSDIFLMPSRFEPCGLNQMYGLAYGTPPVVRRTGGLADSVHDACETNLESGKATGFVFEHANEAEFLTCIRRAVGTFEDKKTWRKLQTNGMRQDLSWTRSAKEYLEVYRSLLQ